MMDGFHILMATMAGDGAAAWARCIIRCW